MPIHQEDRQPVHEFSPEERLYRRYRPEHYKGGKILPAAFQFPKHSVTRGAFSRPEDVLHSDCARGKDVRNCGVLTMLVGSIPRGVSGTDGTKYVFSVRHEPENTCYAHSVIWCQRDGRGTAESECYDEPPATLKEKFRIELALGVTIAIPAPSLPGERGFSSARRVVSSGPRG